MDRVDTSAFSSDVVLLDLADNENENIENRWPMGWTIWFALGGGAALWLVIGALVWII